MRVILGAQPVRNPPLGRLLFLLHRFTAAIGVGGGEALHCSALARVASDPGRPRAFHERFRARPAAIGMTASGSIDSNRGAPARIASAT